MSTAAAVHEVIGVFSGADKMLLFFAARSGFRLVRKGFRSLAWCHTAGGREREREQRQRKLVVGYHPPPLLFPLLLSSQRRGAFLQVQIPPIHWIWRGVCPCSILPLPTELNLYIKHNLGTVVKLRECRFNQAT